MLDSFTRLNATLRLPFIRSPSLSRPLQSASPAYPIQTQARRRSPTAMLKHAVGLPKANKQSQKQPTHQQSLLANPSHASPVPGAFNARPAPCPLAPGSGNLVKQTTSAQGYPVTSYYGTKRTSSGLAKALQSQEDFFEYPLVSASDRGPKQQTSLSKEVSAKSAVYFDENDFDSDIDLDVEDPATKGIIRYPTLPELDDRCSSDTSDHAAISRATTRFTTHGWESDSGYGSRYGSIPPTRNTEAVDKIHSPPESVHDSSQPIPWSSSPIYHYQNPLKAPAIHHFAHNDQAKKEEQPRPTKRRTLPWLDKHSDSVLAQELTPEPTSTARIGRERPRKEPKVSSNFTPLPKASSKSEYPWNTTASAVKEQQKNFRQANKTLVKANEATSEALKEAIAKRKKRQISRVFLSEEQQHVLNLVVDGKKSVFFTGSAGTGKSVLLREIISALRRKYAREPDRVAVTASTGLAACNVGGVTLHSFAGIGLGKEPAEELIKKIRKNQKARHRWMRTRVLIIDEVSMVDGELFDKLEQIARTIRNNGRPFGGIQLVITGDFFQLPPVPDSGRVAKFAFDAGTWTTAVEHTIGLHHVFRQKDPVFAGMLNEMREGRLSPASISAFRKLDRQLPTQDSLEATELFPTRYEVDRANHMRMQQLQGDIYSFEARDGGTIIDKTMRDKLLQNCMAPEVIHLKKGAQVMLIKNMDDTLVNGSLGKVIGFMSESTFDKYNEDEESYHAMEAAGGNADGSDLKAKLKSDLLGITTTQIYPLIRFAIADGTTRDLLCTRETWKVELPNGEVQASRAQVPLILAWALSIHKAQGQTLERVKVDLGKVFEKGQAYVALSRATSMEGLRVLRFDPKKVLAHDKVRNFYNSLSRAEQASGRAKVARKEKAPGLGAFAYEKKFVDGDWEDEEAMAAIRAAA